MELASRLTLRRLLGELSRRNGHGGQSMLLSAINIMPWRWVDTNKASPPWSMKCSRDSAPTRWLRHTMFAPGLWLSSAFSTRFWNFTTKLAPGTLPKLALDLDLASSSGDCILFFTLCTQRPTLFIQPYHNAGHQTFLKTKAAARGLQRHRRWPLDLCEQDEGCAEQTSSSRP